MNLILLDIPEDRVRFFPLSLTRPISMLRHGIFTIAEKWEKNLGITPSFITPEYLSAKFSLMVGEHNICINSRILPDENLVTTIKNLGENEGLFAEDTFLACRADRNMVERSIQRFDFSAVKPSYYKESFRQLSHVTDLFQQNAQAICADIDLTDTGHGRIEDHHTICYNPDQIFIGKEVNIKSSILDADQGPIYIGDRVTLHPGSVIIGPAAILEDSVVSIGAKIRSNTTIGPFCKVGGEVSQVMFQGYSNKSHDGFLGSSVVGEWCNFGAGSNNSNLKNNYSMVRLWDYETGKFSETGLQYCGLIMGDFSKCGINTMFNTGTVVGICANIFGYGYMPKFIPSFSWGNSEGFVDYQLEKAEETIAMVMKRRNKQFYNGESAMLRHLFEFTAKYRGRI